MDKEHPRGRLSKPVEEVRIENRGHFTTHGQSLPLTRREEGPLSGVIRLLGGGTCHGITPLGMSVHLLVPQDGSRVLVKERFVYGILFLSLEFVFTFSCRGLAKAHDLHNNRFLIVCHAGNFSGQAVLISHG